MMKEMLVNNVNLQVIEWNGERVISLRDVDRVHGRIKGTARWRFNANKEHFIEGTDYYKVIRKVLNSELSASNTLKGNPNIEMVLLTKSGYLMIVKVMEDDKAWEVQRQLVDSYFVLEKIAKQKVAKQKAEKEEVSVPSVPSNANVDFMPIVMEQKQMFEMEFKNNEIFRLGLLDSFQKLSNIVIAQTETINKQALMIDKQMEMINNLLNVISPNNVNNANEVVVVVEDVVENVSEENEEPIITVVKTKRNNSFNREYYDWKHNIYNSIIGFDKTEIFKRTYKYMQKHYGICWDQEQKDYKKQTGRYPNSTLELIYFMEKENFALRKLFENCLYTICNANQRIKCEVVYPVKSVKEMETLGAYIVKATNNKSPHGASMWRKFFDNVHQNYENDLPTYEKTYRYEKELSPKVRVSKLELIKEYDNLEKFYVNQFNKWVKEVYSEIVSQLTK